MAHAKSTDPDIFILPDLGEGVHEAELIAWKVSVGDTVEEHDIMAEMETDKALVEVPSPRAGVVAELYGNPGDILNVGEPAWRYEGSGGQSATPASAPPRMTEPTPDPEANGSAPTATTEEREDAGTVVGNVSGDVAGVSTKGGKALATPAVRRVARDLGVDIDSIAGTGMAGRVTEKDVRALTGAGTPQLAPRTIEATPTHAPVTRIAPQQEIVEAPPRARATLVPTGDANRIPLRGVRRKIAERLRQSVDRAVHFCVMDEADVTKLDEVRRQMAAASGEKLSYLPFIASAVIRAIKQFPSLNALVDDENQEIVRYPKVHLGIAADTDQGLSVPVIFDADTMGVLEMGREISEIARMVRDRSIPRERLMGSTFTISNFGSEAGKFATPIINYPEVGILASGRVYDGVVAKAGGIHVAKMMPLSLTCDHRCVDGADAARCLAMIIKLLGRPDELLTPARR